MSTGISLIWLGSTPKGSRESTTISPSFNFQGTFVLLLKTDPGCVDGIQRSGAQLLRIHGEDSGIPDNQAT